MRYRQLRRTETVTGSTVWVCFGVPELWLHKQVRIVALDLEADAARISCADPPEGWGGGDPNRTFGINISSLGMPMGGNYGEEEDA